MNHKIAKYLYRRSNKRDFEVQIAKAERRRRILGLPPPSQSKLRQKQQLEIEANSPFRHYYIAADQRNYIDLSSRSLREHLKGNYFEVSVSTD